MKTPHLVTAMMAASAIGMGAHEAEPRSITYTSTQSAPGSDESYARRIGGRLGLNQRQKRKDRRRAHAAGCKKAFV